MGRSLEIATDALAVLSACRCDGNVVFLPATQLDRKLYQRVNDVLEALGGKWNRKAKGHVFDDDPQARLDDVILTGSVERLRIKDTLGQFDTPEALALEVVERADIRPGMKLLEPSAGLGRLVDAAFKVEPAIGEAQLVEIDRARCAALRGKGYAPVEGDFLALAAEPRLGARFDRVVMNPPFAKRADIAHVRSALSMLRPDGLLISIMSAGVAFRRDRLAVEFRELVEERGGSIEALPDGSFKESDTSVRTVLVTIPMAA